MIILMLIKKFGCGDQDIIYAIGFELELEYYMTGQTGRQAS